MFWLVFTLLVLLFAYYGVEKNCKKWTQSIAARVALVLILSYAVALCGYGNDRDAYLSIYEYSLSSYHFDNIREWVSLSSSDFELGFILLCKLCNFLGLSGVGMLLIMAIITNTLIVDTFYKFKYPLITFFLYILSVYYLQQTNLMRQMLAAAIGIYCLRFVNNKNWIKYLAGVFCAYLIHKTSIILIVFLPICFLKEGKNKVVHITLIVLWGISLLSALGLFRLGLSYFSDLIVMSRYERFYNSDSTLGVSEQHFNWLYNLLVIFYFIHKSNKTSENYIYWVFFVVGAIMSNIALNTIVLQRLTYYFAPIYCVMAPALMIENEFSRKDLSNKKVLVGFLLLYHGRQLIPRIMSGVEQLGKHISSISEIFR